MPTLFHLWIPFTIISVWTVSPMSRIHFYLFMLVSFNQIMHFWLQLISQWKLAWYYSMCLDLSWQDQVLIYRRYLSPCVFLTSQAIDSFIIFNLTRSAEKFQSVKIALNCIAFHSFYRVVKTRRRQDVALVEIEWRYEGDNVDTYNPKWENCPKEFVTLENQQVELIS